jgi:hypothetical protein
MDGVPRNGSAEKVTTGGVLIVFVRNLKVTFNGSAIVEAPCSSSLQK